MALTVFVLDCSWNVMAHGDAREGKWRGNRRMEWVASTLHTTLEHIVSSITTADAHTSAASSRLNWRPRWFKWTRPFRRNTISGFCACAITFQLASASFPSSLTTMPGALLQKLAGSVRSRECQRLCRLRLKCDGIRWRTGGKVKGKQENGVGSQ